MRNKWYYLLKNSLFAPIMEFFAQSQKTLNVGKYDEERVFFQEKKTFSFFKSLLYKNGTAQNKPLAAGHLVMLLLQWYSEFVCSPFLTFHSKTTLKDCKDFSCLPEKFDILRTSDISSCAVVLLNVQTDLASFCVFLGKLVSCNIYIFFSR